MESELENLQLEIKGALYNLTVEQLIEVCITLQLSAPGREPLTSKTRSRLISNVVKYLEREELASLEDEGMSEYLSIWDTINKVKSVEESPRVETQSDDQERLQKEIEALRLSLQQKEKEAQGVMDRKYLSCPRVSQINVTPTFSENPMWRKDFKILGQIGEPGQKDRLTFSSLARQIESGLTKGYSETDIIDAVIRAITPGLQLRSYLEGKETLTLPALRRILRSHYQERGATDLYKQLTSEVQCNKESPQNFLIRAMDLRQKILFASQEAESALKYDPALVQNLFMHTILTGLQNDNIKSDLQPYLTKPDTPDELLLEKVNIACTNEKERQDKKRHAAPQRATSVSTVQTGELPRETKTSTQQSRSQMSPDVLSEIKEMRSDMVLLKDLRAEVSQIRETIQKNANAQSRQPPPSSEQVSTASPVFSPTEQSFRSMSPMMPVYPQQHPELLREYRPLYDPGWMRGTAQFQQRFAPQRYYQRQRQQPRCFACTQANEEYCQHCFRCGSTEHFRAGCRADKAAHSTYRGSLN